MSVGLLGKKCGMTRIFTESGESIPVTVLQVDNNRISQIKSMDVDGYSAVQVVNGSKKSSRVNKPLSGHYAKAGVEAGDFIKEFRLESSDGYSLGQVLSVEMFEVGDKVDVVGTSKGKGFAGGVKRHNFKMQDATHGNSISHRAPGSIGQCQTPGRVFKGKKMAGHMGNVQRTAQNLEIAQIDNEKGLLLVKGAIPGPKSGNVVIKQAIKR
ncbi:MAG: 50S ribosomal protein L3 [Methylococcales bacterium]|jgi:large subunit ribosomal protein L3|nr:50S ribosomal protein L3 [Methylococcales bacterium]MBT7445607.1 50S ribosomal protein L3 [Methylococcales bacterium]